MSNELPSWMDAELWEDFKQNRKEIGAPLTPTAEKRLLIKLYRMKEAGEDIETALERSIEGRWKGVYPVPSDQKQSSHSTHREAPKEEVPEISDEERERNLEYLRRETAKVFNFTGGRQ